MNPEQAGAVAVMMGGVSAESDISRQSGEAVLASLQSQGFAARPVDIAQPFMEQFLYHQYQRAFIVVHGRDGEDGRIQGALDLLHIPYTGSGVQASAVAFDKALCKNIWSAAGLPTPDFCVVDSAADLPQISFPLPWAVKPARAGSSHGITLVDNKKDLADAVRHAGRYDNKVLVEQWIAGGEYTASILHNQVLPLVKLETSRSFYDYTAKYQSGNTSYICPCGLDVDQEAALAEITMAAFDVVCASGWGRIDFMLDDDGAVHLLELNTVPGLTVHSLVPKAAVAAGMSFDELVCAILASSSTAVGGVGDV